MKKFLTISSAAMLTVALAQPQISPQSIIVNPIDPDLKVRVWTAKDATGELVPDYRPGEKITLYTAVNEDAYVYLFNVNPDGTIDQILPNRYSDGSNFLKANTVKQFPAPGANFTFDIAGPAGINKVLALASKSQLNLDQISQFRAQGNFAEVRVRGQENLAQALSIVVRPIPQNNWATDTALYNVVIPGRFGGLNVTSNVANAQVFLNDRLVGTAGTPIADIQPGRYNVRVTAPGYTPFTGAVNVTANQTLNLSAQLQAQRVPLTIRSNVEGAQVFIDGRQAGVIRGGNYSTTLERDSYQIVLIAPGYSAAVSNVQVQTGGAITLNLNRLP